MPEPIKPIHKLNEHSEMFEQSGELSMGLSELQTILMGQPTQKVAASKYSEVDVEMLEKIFDHKDEITTAAQKLMTKNQVKEALYDVPKSISDNALLGLKTEGLIVGSGRKVKFTEAGRKVLKMRFLSEKNQLESNRKSDRFELRSAGNNSKFKRIG